MKIVLQTTASLPPLKTKWLKCPYCDQKTRTKVYPDTVLLNFPLYCPKCKREMRIGYALNKLLLNDNT